MIFSSFYGEVPSRAVSEGGLSSGDETVSIFLSITSLPMKSLSFLKGVNSVENETFKAVIGELGKKAEDSGPFYKYPISFYLIFKNIIIKSSPIT